MRPRPSRLRPLVLLLLWCALAAAGCGGGEEKPDDLAARREAEARRLASLGYVNQVVVKEENRGLRGVVRHDRDRAVPGLNLYASLTSCRAVLRDMDGAIVHTWSAEGVFDDRVTFPLGPEVIELANGPFSPGWTVAELDGDDLLAIESHVGLLRLDRAGHVKFALANQAHHDVAVDPDGSIWTLTAVPRRIDTGGEDVLIVDDVVQHLDRDGRVLAEHSLFRILSRDPGVRPVLAEGMRYARHWFRNLDQWRDTRMEQDPVAADAFRAMFDLYAEVFVRGERELRPSHQLFVLYLTPADVLHTNALQVLPAHPAGLWPAGAMLVSVRNLNLVAVLDLAAEKVLWTWGPGELNAQHQPSILPDGHLLVFDNGTARGYTRVLEVDPATGAIVWNWGEAADQRFWCSAMGGVEGLPGGNVLITDSSAGRAFEVTRDGAIVWDFFNPEQGHNPFGAAGKAETIEAIYRLGRVPVSAFPPATKP
ncbi:aryl-sulfate sulfotransferase [bacterium]|nr:aryl-sulfate sulfotransferase [bacterium]